MNWRSTRKVLAIFLASALTSACNAHQPSPDWNGTWKLNPSRSSYQGPLIIISMSADGEYRLDYGSTSFTFRCDGKDRPIGDNDTRACVKSSATVLDLVRKTNGAKTRTNHWELSDGGEVLTSTTTEFGPSGAVITTQVVASRISGSSEFVGHWQDRSYLHQHADMTLGLDNQALHIGYPDAGQYIDASLDGADAAVHGPHAPEGTTRAVRRIGKREFLVLSKRNGKVLTQGSLELSSDGNTVIDSWWNPDRPTDKGVLVYEKQ